MSRFWLQTTLSGLVLLVAVFNLPVMIDQIDLVSQPTAEESAASGRVEGVIDNKPDLPKSIPLKSSQLSPSPSLSPQNKSVVASTSVASEVSVTLPTTSPKVETTKAAPIKEKQTLTIIRAELTNHHSDYLTLSWQDELAKVKAYQVRFSAAPITTQNWEEAELAEVIFPADKQSLVLNQEHFFLLRRPDLEQGYLGISLIDEAKYIFGLGQELVF